jgi:hypothetical protein
MESDTLTLADFYHVVLTLRCKYVVLYCTYSLARDTLQALYHLHYPPLRIRGVLGAGNICTEAIFIVTLRNKIAVHCR